MLCCAASYFFCILASSQPASRSDVGRGRQAGEAAAAWWCGVSNQRRIRKGTETRVGLEGRVMVIV